MKKKEKTTDMLNLFKIFKTSVLDRQPTPEQMLIDVRMMKFKIRPIQGDVSFLDFSNTHFVETLWKLGKMDDFIERHIAKINKKQEKAFFSYFDGLYNQLQDALNSIHLGEIHPHKHKTEKHVVEMEIFKERTRKKEVN